MRNIVEHVICRMKKYKIFGLRYRNRLRYYDLMTDIVSGLVNMRIIGLNTKKRREESDISMQ